MDRLPVYHKATLISTICLAVHSHISMEVLQPLLVYLYQLCREGVLTKWFLLASLSCENHNKNRYSRNMTVKLLFCEHSSSLYTIYCWFIIADAIILQSLLDTPVPHLLFVLHLLFLHIHLSCGALAFHTIVIYLWLYLFLLKSFQLEIYLYLYLAPISQPPPLLY